MKNRFFSQKIVEWYQEHHRDLPWRNTQEPYKIWLSEIILQQTRVIQGLPYYEKFIQQFPEINSLARAKEEQVLRLWQGLGYYTRARNLHKCARKLVEQFNGIFPSGYTELKKLPGIGDYTAAAIASFAFNERVAVVDGNVQRVLSRVFGIMENVSTSAGKKYFFDLANSLMHVSDPALFNQAMMEFGALQCIPKNPSCESCILQKHCYARLHGQQKLFPVKRKPAKITRRFLYYFVFIDGKRILMKKRSGKDIWKGLYDFPLLEKKQAIAKGKSSSLFSTLPQLKITPTQKYQISKVYKHVLTHQVIHAQFIQVIYPKQKAKRLAQRIENSGWYSSSQVEKLPKPVLISHFLQEL